MQGHQTECDEVCFGLLLVCVLVLVICLTGF